MPNSPLPDDLAARTPDAWTWIARYEDGSTLGEYEVDGDHGFAEIDLTRIRTLELHPVRPDLPSFAVLIDPSKDQRPIFFRRRASNSMLGDPGFHMYTALGRQDTVRIATFDKSGLPIHVRRNVQTVVLFDDQGHIVIADNGDPFSTNGSSP